MDGTLRGLLREQASTGVSVIEAMTPEPVGDLPIEQWAARAGNPRTILWGGVPGVYFTAKVSDREFDRHIRMFGMSCALILAMSLVLPTRCRRMLWSTGCDGWESWWRSMGV